MHQIPSRPSHRNAAFTLIELLVVISIIALLVGILLPALASARKAAQAAVSQSNVRQISVALFMYQDLFKGALPEGEHGGGFDDTWMGRSVEFIAETGDDPSSFYRSPLDELTEQWAGDKLTSYGVNASLSSEHPPYFGVTYAEIRNPSGFVWIGELAEEEGATEFEDHFTPQFWGDPAPFTPVAGAYPLDHPLSGTPEDPYDYTDDADENWEAGAPAHLGITKVANSSGIYGFGEGHVAMHAIDDLFEYTAGIGATPSLNAFDPMYPGEASGF